MENGTVAPPSGSGRGAKSQIPARSLSMLARDNGKPLWLLPRGLAGAAGAILEALMLASGIRRIQANHA